MQTDKTKPRWLWALIARLADLGSLGYLMLAIIVAFGGGAAVAGVVGAVKHGHVPAWVLFGPVIPTIFLILALRPGAQDEADAAYQRGDKEGYERGKAEPRDSDSELAQQVATLERRLNNAVLEGKIAKSFVNHIAGLTSEIRTACGADTAKQARAFERLRDLVFGAASEGLHREGGEHMRCAFFTPFVDERGVTKLRALPGHHHGHTSVLEDSALDLNSSLAGYAYTNRRTASSKNARDDPRFQRLGVIELDDFGSIICAPGWGTTAKAPPVGVLSVGSTEANRFDETDERFVAICADALVLVDSLLEGLASDDLEPKGEK